MIKGSTAAFPGEKEIRGPKDRGTSLPPAQVGNVDCQEWVFLFVVKMGEVSSRSLNNSQLLVPSVAEHAGHGDCFAKCL